RGRSPGPRCRTPASGRPNAAAWVWSVPPRGIEFNEVISNRVFDFVRTVQADRCARNALSTILRLPEGENFVSVRVGVIVGFRYRLYYVSRRAGIATYDPHAGALPFAIADMKALTDDFIIGLATHPSLERAALVSRSVSRLVLPQRKPRFLSNLVQYTGVNVSEQARTQCRKTGDLQ